VDLLLELKSRNLNRGHLPPKWFNFTKRVWAQKQLRRKLGIPCLQWNGILKLAAKTQERDRSAISIPEKYFPLMRL